MQIQVLCHSSIKITTDKIIYLDPFKIKEENHDADIIMITHSHYDHFSEKDINKIKNSYTKILITRDLLSKTLELGFEDKNIIIVEPNNIYNVLNIKIQTIPAYNTNKMFHPKDNNWVGYILLIEDKKIYIAGDTDITEENKKIKVDIALVPIGGTYTMTAKEAAQLVNIIKPKIAIPIHYAEIVGTEEDAKQFKQLVDKTINVEYVRKH